jgi:uncharacterized protein YpiB (UPF0302 family)
MNESETSQAMYVSEIEARSCNHCYSKESIRITHSECVFVALFIRHAKRMCRIILPSVACQSPQYLSTLSHKRHDIRTRYSTSNVCFYFL